MKALIKSSVIFFCIGSLCTSCFNPDDYVTPKDDIIKLVKGEESEKLANGVDAALITAQISDKAAPGRRKVIFKTSLGFFLGGKGDSIVVEADESFKASAKVVSLKAGTANVTAKIMEIKAKDVINITFSKAFPDSISVSVDSFSVANSFKSEILITASLSAPNGGKPSAGHEVMFSVNDSVGNNIGTFLNNINTSKTDTDGKAKIRYSAGEVDQEGYLTVIATTEDEDKNEITATTRIYLSNQK